MSILPLIPARSAAEVCARFTLPPDAQPLLQTGPGVREFLEAAVAKKQYIAGIDFLAHGLPPHQGIWWGCLCMRHACGANLSPVDQAASRAAVQWLMQPTEEHRAETRVPAEAAGPASPAGRLAAAAFQTGGNVAPPKAPPAAPEPFASAVAVAHAVKLACLKSGPAGIARAQKAFVELGIWVAEGNT